MIAKHDARFPLSDSPSAQPFTPPVILIGRGGSGTRLLSQLVESMGVFLGNDLNVSFDSVEWVDDLYALAVETTAQTSGSDPQRQHYWRERLLQCANTILSNAPDSAPDLWGWKLPETILCLPQVLHTFPRARFIHLVRHPLTSAFRRTHITSRWNNHLGRAVLTSAYQSLGIDVERILVDEPYMHNAITWHYQVQKAIDEMNALGDDSRLLHVRYEDLCDDPEFVQQEIRTFLGMELISGRHPIAIEKSRQGGVTMDAAEADAVWAICGNVAEKFGYDRNLPE